MGAQCKKARILLISIGLILFSINHLSTALGTEPQHDQPWHEDRYQQHRPSVKPGHHQRYSIELAVSDQAQLDTIAFSGRAFITGDFDASTFTSPGVSASDPSKSVEC